jgi:flavorubredoxin
MASLTLFDNGTHRNILLEDFGHGQMVQANQHLIVHEGHAMILDPGGHKVYSKALAETTSLLKGGKLDMIFFSHQDPDIVAAANGWLMTTDAEALASQLWLRFIPHFGLDTLVASRLRGIPDEGMVTKLGGSPIIIVPAHFLHSEGNFQVYDPVSKILYTGDLGASLGMDYREVPDFDSHLQYMEGFHRRYMTSKSVMTAWAAMVRSLDIDIIAPQHGAIFKGKELVNRFINWCDGFECGVDLILPKYKIPTS